jgi:hypothetical protein
VVAVEGCSRFEDKTVRTLHSMVRFPLVEEVAQAIQTQLPIVEGLAAAAHIPTQVELLLAFRDRETAAQTPSVSMVAVVVAEAQVRRDRNPSMLFVPAMVARAPPRASRALLSSMQAEEVGAFRTATTTTPPALEARK